MCSPISDPRENSRKTRTWLPGLLRASPGFSSRHDTDFVMADSETVVLRSTPHTRETNPEQSTPVAFATIQKLRPASLHVQTLPASCWVPILVRKASTEI